jgi:hypothetical protein
MGTKRERKEELEVGRGLVVGWLVGWLVLVDVQLLSILSSYMYNNLGRVALRVYAYILGRKLGFWCERGVENVITRGVTGWRPLL